MKNYLYILCTFLLAFAGCTKDADVEPIAPAPDENAQVVLTGFSGRGTRTGFGGAEDGAVPFLWSAGDYIWASNTRSEAIAEGGSQATFIFESIATADTYDVFYNLTGPAAATALIPAEQTQQAADELNLGQNGDFGYAKAQNGTFTLEHATSYVWFDTYSSDVTSNLLSITLSVSGGQTIAGEAAFADGKLGDCKGSSSVTLSFGEEGVALPSQSNDTDVFAAMVLYPADLSTATVSIVYKFADGSVYLQTKSGKTLTPGHTLRLSTQIAKSDCKSSGAFFMTEAGVAEELPTEPIGYLKVVTLGESTLSAEELTSIAGNLANGAVIDLGEATFATTEFPMDFTRKTNLQEIALPRNIQTFTPSTYNSGAFYGCENLTRVTFPEGLTAIGQNCFRNCAKLESIELPSSVRTLDIYAFYGCKLLTSVVIPEGVEAIPRFLFDSCTALTDVTLPSTLKSIGAEAFEATGLEEITIPESVTTIESSVFKNCKSLERIQFPDALTAIPANLCNACSALTTINMPSKLETVGNGEPVSDDPADDYALYTMPSGCAGEFILPSLQRVNGSMLVSTWNTSTDRAVAFRFPSLQSVAGEISVGHTAYKNRSVATLDFSALTAAGAIRIGNLSSVTDFSTFTQVLPRLSEQTWSVTDCGYNPTYQQMLDGETGAESK